MPFDWQAELFSPSAALSTPVPSTRVTSPSAAVPANQTPPRTFAQALVASHSKVTNDNLPQPTIRGDTLSIRITQPVYEQGVNLCK